MSGLCVKSAKRWAEVPCFVTSARRNNAMGNIDASYNNPLVYIPNDWQAGDRILTAEDLFGDESMHNLEPYGCCLIA